MTSPPAAARLLAEAGAALSRGHLDAAERALSGALGLASDSVEAHRLMGIVHQLRGHNAKAVDCLQRACNLRPGDATIRMNLGSALYEHGDIAAALLSLRHACELMPGMAACWYNLGKALKMQLRTGEADDALHRALSIDPAHIAARICLADLQTSRGDIPAATGNYREILRRQPEHPDAWFGLANLKTESFDRHDTDELQRLFLQREKPADTRISIGFALAKALEDQHDDAAAFDVLQQVNALKARQVNWDAVAERRQVDAIIEACPEPLAGSADATLGNEIILIVSLPRSGSTLIEQILASHPQVEGANEITDLPQVIEDESKRRGQPFPQWVHSATPADWTRLGRDYLERTARWRRRRPRSTDKNLVTWQLVGPALAMLPGARVVNVHRNPLETCLSCYRQLFSNGAHFSYDLDDMAGYYADYQRLGRHWQRLYPQQMLDCAYESLQLDTEQQIRRLLDFCGLPFDPACVAFHQTSRTVLSTASAAQVRQPLRTDTARSARYGDKLQRLRESLHSAGVET